MFGVHTGRHKQFCDMLAEKPAAVIKTSVNVLVLRDYIICPIFFKDSE